MKFRDSDFTFGKKGPRTVKDFVKPEGHSDSDQRTKIILWAVVQGAIITGALIVVMLALMSLPML
jgi:hypothetical protein